MSWSSRPGRSSGVTLLELLVTLVIMSILASAALPYAELTIRRNNELELRQALREVRTAIDEFHNDWKNGKISRHNSFMIVYYRLSGVIADFALVLNLVCLMGALSALTATLTLPGIAGIVLTIGMGVDSNVLIFERIREELRGGKAPRSAIDAGYDKALLTIIDSHVTTLITGVALFLFGTGPNKGFAVTLCLGIAINLFTALVGTKVIFDLLYHRQKVEALSI